MIAIWNVQVPDSKAKFSVTIDQTAVVAVAFTPDGGFIAGATVDRIDIWKVGEPTFPRARWTRKPLAGHVSPKLNGGSDEETITEPHCLSWDATGENIAFGVNNRVCIWPFGLSGVSN